MKFHSTQQQKRISEYSEKVGESLFTENVFIFNFIQYTFKYY